MLDILYHTHTHIAFTRFWDKGYTKAKIQKLLIPNIYCFKNKLLGHFRGVMAFASYGLGGAERFTMGWGGIERTRKFWRAAITAKPVTPVSLGVASSLVL
jgi:hypothetical protein